MEGKEETQQNQEGKGTSIREEYRDEGAFDCVMKRDDQVPKKPVASLSYGERVRIASLHDTHEQYMYKIINVAGWAKTVRLGGKDFCFVELNDGSCFTGLQVVVDKSVENFDELVKCNVGSCFKFTGTLIKSPAQGQVFELQVSQQDKHAITIFGKQNAKEYPLSKKKHTLEFLRDIAHLRPRTNTFGAVTRMRNNLAYATHQFFQERGFLYIHTPIITASDCEGAGEMFNVTTLLPEPHDSISKLELNDGREKWRKEHEDKVSALKKVVQEAKKASKKAKKAQKKTEGEEGKEVEKTEEEKFEYEKFLELKALEEEKEPEADAFQDRKVNYKKDFFGKQASLTVSGQLNVENFACSLSDVYTFGPTFRAENSNTTRHAAEFWMIEPEISFATLQDDMNLAEDYVKYCISYVLKNNADDIAFFDKMVEKGLKERLEQVVNSEFKRVDYTDAVKILMEKIEAKEVKFENPVSWGIDLASEHEKYLTDVVFKGPIFVFNYPKDIKAFYMRMNDDGKTVQAMDMLVPRIGELIGGSAREERLEVLDQRLEELKLEKEDYWWYRELRKYGTVPHAGFGLGFERLIMMTTGVENIRDVIPFPRTPGTCEF